MVRRSASELGKEGERRAYKLLGREGYRILETNFRGGGGEIDIIALEKGTICFVEVKTRRSEAAGSPEEAVDGRKMKRIVRAARTYMGIHGLDEIPIRFDLVAYRVSGEDEFDTELTRGGFYEDGWA
ncbi:MAG: YraN family protein [Planctomycetota bacterium]|jgi:putative endonuclease